MLFGGNEYNSSLHGKELGRTLELLLLLKNDNEEPLYYYYYSETIIIVIIINLYRIVNPNVSLKFRIIHFVWNMMNRKIVTAFQLFTPY